ncbi:hypothetical protein MSG28_008598, partial [Choristoneura fumiferana]
VSFPTGTDFVILNAIPSLGGDASLRIQTKNISHEHFDFGALVKLVNGLKDKLNLTKSPESTCNYCSGSFRDIVLAYNGIHGYFSLLVCFFGTLANALNVVVLTRRDLAAAPINRLLKWLAVADVFVMMEYVPFAVYRYLVSFPTGTDFVILNAIPSLGGDGF